MSQDFSTIIIGAGASGLSAAVRLANAGLDIAILEARDRIGGRMFTVHDAVSASPIELGAEFVHGRPPEIWNIAAKEGIGINETSGENWSARHGELQRADIFSDVDDILSRMSDREPDRSFADFLANCCPHSTPEARERALAYITGFHAADPSEVSVHSLIKSMRADEQIDGERTFRLQGGYQSLLNVYRETLARLSVSIHLNTVVQSITSHKAGAEIVVTQKASRITFSARRVLITLPLGVLQLPSERGGVRFVPELPAAKRTALERLAMGKVIRLTLCFGKRFWDDIRPSPGQPDTLTDMRFLFSQEKPFPTWWTTLPDQLPVLVAWAPFRAAEALTGQAESSVVNSAHKVLGRLLRMDQSRIASWHRATYWHDWEADPFSHGAYSYVKVGGKDAQRELGSPVDNTLFFAGEATDTSGHNGTVHGAIASGERAARELLDCIS
jgi:monoamine oxidase